MAFWPQNLTRCKNPPGLEEVRARYAAIFARFGAAAATMDFRPGQLGPVPGEWVGAIGSGPGRTLLYFHGGGFVAGSPETHRRLVARLVEASGVSAFSVAIPPGAGILLSRRGARRHRCLSRAAGQGRERLIHHPGRR